MKKQNCIGCIENSPDQYSHSYFGGCMFEEEEEINEKQIQILSFVKNNDFINLNFFLQNNYVDINFEDNDGKTLLEIAIENKNIQIIKLLVNYDQTV